MPADFSLLSWQDDPLPSLFTPSDPSNYQHYSVCKVLCWQTPPRRESLHVPRHKFPCQLQSPLEAGVSTQPIHLIPQQAWFGTRPSFAAIDEDRQSFPSRVHSRLFTTASYTSKRGFANAR